MSAPAFPTPATPVATSRIRSMPRPPAPSRPRFKHRVVSWNSLRDAETVEDWGLDDSNTDDEISGEDLAGIARGIERRLRTLVRSKVIRPGRIVSLPTSPLAFLGAAPLFDGRWIDATVGELAEMGGILADGGFTRQASGDPHLFAWREFVQTDSRGAPSPIDDAAWNEARRTATVPIRAYRGRRSVFGGRDYVEFALYQRSRKRLLGCRLDASTDSGFVVRPITPIVDAEAWTVHDADRARRLQTARANVIAHLPPSGSDRRSSTAVELECGAAGASRRDDALEIVVRAEGLARALDRIRAHYFRDHEIVFADLADTLGACRTGIVCVLSMFEQLRESDDCWIAFLIDPSLSEEDETTDSDYDDLLKRVQERIDHVARNKVRELVHRARFEGLDFVGEFRAARTVIDKELEAMFG